MFILGLQGSPRKKGNTECLLSAFFDEAEKAGADTLIINPDEMNIGACTGCRNCEKSGLCALPDDDMNSIVFPALRRADLIVMAAPVFFYGVPSRLKALIDRCQVLWSRKYQLRLEDPGSKWRKWFLLSAGARKNADLFNGIIMTGKYFFNSIGAVHAGSLTYNEIEKSGDILNHPSAISDARGKASELLLSLSKRKRVIFICSGNAGRSQMSAAFAQIRAGDRLEVISGGSSPANEISSVMQQVMAEKGIDMAFRKPMSIVNALGGKPVDCAVTMGCGVSCPVLPGAEIIQWDLPDPRGKPVEFMRVLRDEIEKKVIDLAGKL